MLKWDDPSTVGCNISFKGDPELNKSEVHELSLNIYARSIYMNCYLLLTMGVM